MIEAAEHGDAISSAGSEIEQLRSELLRVAGERDTATRERDIAREDLQKKSEILAEMSVRLEALTSKSGATSDAKPTSDVRSADPKLVTHINNLQEQLYAERNNNRRLKGSIEVCWSRSQVSAGCGGTGSERTRTTLAVLLGRSTTTPRALS